MRAWLYVLALAACESSSLVVPVDAGPPDLTTACRPPCAADEVCLHPCNDLVYCYPPLDGGCLPWGSLQPCDARGTLGCGFDFTPRCEPAASVVYYPPPGCKRVGADLICRCP